jgi:hypothetical protein
VVETFLFDSLSGSFSEEIGGLDEIERMASR